MNYARTIINFRDVVTADSFSQKLTINAKYELTPDTAIKLDVRPSGDFKSDVLLSFSTEDESITIEGQEITLSKSAEQMNIVPGKYMYNCQFTKATITTTLFGGIFEIIQDKTTY